MQTGLGVWSTLSLITTDGDAAPSTPNTKVNRHQSLGSLFDAIVDFAVTAAHPCRKRGESGGEDAIGIGTEHQVQVDGELVGDGAGCWVLGPGWRVS